jgi:hypothetical protein
MNANDRYALVPLANGGLLLDLESGGLFELNATASLVWQLFLDGADAGMIASTIAERHGIAVARASADVATVLEPPPAPPALARQDYEFQRTSNGYVQLFRDRPALEIDATGDELALLTPTADRHLRNLKNNLRAMVPKILSLRGQTVLHASAVVVQGRLVAFSGRSGAGKTTTARALVERGATPVSEDKLLIRAGRDGAFAWRGAEPYLDAWVLQAGITLLAQGRVSCIDLDEATRGEELPLAEIGFLDVVPREGEALIVTRLGAQAAAAATFRAMFLGTALTTGWRRQLEAAGAIAENVPSYAVKMPDGLGALGRAAEEVARHGTLTVRA